MGQKSPAKILRNTKRMTNFLRNKWKGNDSNLRPILTPQPMSKKSVQNLAIFHVQNTSIPPKPPPNLTFQCVQTTSIPPYSPPQTSSCSCNQTLSPTEKVKPLLNEELQLILNQSEVENQIEREKRKQERENLRELGHTKLVKKVSWSRGV